MTTKTKTKRVEKVEHFDVSVAEEDNKVVVWIHKPNTPEGKALCQEISLEDELYDELNDYVSDLNSRLKEAYEKAGTKS